MVIPTELDVVFHGPSSSSKYSESVGNCIFRKLLEEHYVDYFFQPNTELGDETNDHEQHQKAIRRLVLRLFYEQTSVLATERRLCNHPGVRLDPNRNSEFYKHMQQGDCVSYAKVCYQKNIDEKIKESFERMRVERGDEFECDENDPGNYVSLGFTTTATKKPSSSFSNANPKVPTNHDGNSSIDLVQWNHPGLMTEVGISNIVLSDNHLNSDMVSMRYSAGSSPSVNNWDKDEHVLFMKAIRMCGTKDWQKIASMVGTRTAAEIKNYVIGSLNAARLKSYAKNWENVSEFIEFLQLLPTDYIQNPSSTIEESLKAIQDNVEIESHGPSTINNAASMVPKTVFPTRAGKKRRIHARNIDSKSNGETSSPVQKKKAMLTDENSTSSSPTNTKNWGKIQQMLFRGKQKLTAEGSSLMVNSGETEHSLHHSKSASGLKPMDKITNSPYEGNLSAETNEEPLENLKGYLQATANGANPILEKHFGSHLAATLIQAREAIRKCKVLYSDNWKVGKIGGSKFGWIPKRHLLLCLSEEKLGSIMTTTAAQTARAEHKNGSNEHDENSMLQAVTRKLECFELVIWILKVWNLKFEYPELFSNKNEREFIFKVTSPADRTRCYKCQIFVARAAATLIFMKKEHISQVGDSLVSKIKTCLGIMNQHVEAYPIVFEKLLKKKRKREDASSGRRLSVSTESEDSNRMKEKLKSNVGNMQTMNLASLFGKGFDGNTLFPGHHLNRTFSIAGTCEEREATLLATYGIMEKLTSRYTKLIKHIQGHLPEGLEEMKAEMRKSIQSKQFLSSSKMPEGCRRRNKDHKFG